MEINGAGLWFIGLFIWYILYDPYIIRKIITSIYWTVNFALRKPFETFIVTHFGEKNALFVYAGIYIFCDGIQIVSHYFIEGHYLHNWAMLLVYQPYYTVWGYMHKLFGFYGSEEMEILVKSRVDYYLEHPHEHPRILKNVDPLMLKLMKLMHHFGRRFLPRKFVHISNFDSITGHSTHPFHSYSQTILLLI